MHEGYRLTSVATLQAIEDRSNFYRLDWRLLSPFVLTLVHLGKDILSQATFGAGDAVRVGRRAEAFSVIESLQPVSLPLSFVLSEVPQSVTHFKISSTVVNSAMLPTACDRTFIFLRCFIFCTFLLAGRTILSALIHSSYLKTKIKYKDSRQFYQLRLLEGDFSNIRSTKQTPLLSAPNMLLLHNQHQQPRRKSHGVMWKRTNLYDEERNNINTNHHTNSLSTEFQQYRVGRGCYLGRMRKMEVSQHRTQHTRCKDHPTVFHRVLEDHTTTLRQ